MPSERKTPPTIRRMTKVARGAVSGGSNRKSRSRWICLIPMTTAVPIIGSLRRSSLSSRHSVGERLQVLRVRVGYERVAQVALSPEERMEPTRALESAAHVAHRHGRDRRPWHAFRAKHEQCDEVQPPLEDEGGRLAVEEVR